MSVATLDPKAEMAQAAQSITNNTLNGPTDFDRNKWLQDRREWLARYRGLFGEVKGAENDARQLRINQIKNVVDFGSSFIKGAFNLKSSTGIFSTAFNLALGAWQIGSTALLFKKVEEKKANMGSTMWDHINFTAAAIFQEPKLTSASGAPLEVPDFERTIQSALKDEVYGAGKRPIPLTAEAAKFLPARPQL